MSIELIQKVITDYYAATRAMDVGAWLATMAEDVASYQPVGTPALQGHETLRLFFTNIVSAFETVGLTEDFVHISDNEVAVKWTGRGIGKSGQEVRFEGIDLFEIDARGLIQTVRAYWDPTVLMAELQV